MEKNFLPFCGHFIIILYLHVKLVNNYFHFMSFHVGFQKIFNCFTNIFFLLLKWKEGGRCVSVILSHVAVSVIIIVLVIGILFIYVMGKMFLAHTTFTKTNSRLLKGCSTGAYIAFIKNIIFLHLFFLISLLPIDLESFCFGYTIGIGLFVSFSLGKDIICGLFFVVVWVGNSYQIRYSKKDAPVDKFL